MQENTVKNFSINLRFIEILDHYKLTRYAFSKETGISQTVLLNIYEGKSKVSTNVIEKLLQHYEANANYIFTGKGAKIKAETTSKQYTLNEPKQEYSKPTQCEQCAVKNKMIDILQSNLNQANIDRDRLARIIETLSHAQNEDSRKRSAG